MKSIQSSLFVGFLCLILFMTMVLSYVSYRLSADAVRQNSQKYTAELINQVGANIRTYITSMENISQLTLNDNDVRNYVSKPEFASAAEKKAYEEKISALFHSILISRKDIASIHVFGYNGRFVSDREEAVINPNFNIRTQSWYHKAKKSAGRAVISSSHVQNIFRDEYRWVVSLSRELIDDRGKGIGILLVDLNYSVIDDLLGAIDLGKGGYIFIIDNDGNIVYHPQQQLVYSKLKTEMIDRVIKAENDSFVTDEGTQSRMYTIQDTGFGWKIVGVAYLNELVGNKEEIRLSFILWGAVCLFIGFVLSVVISLRLSRPIKQLQAQMKEVEKGNFDIRAEISSTNEIGKLARAFNIMVGRIKELMSQVVKEQEFKRKSELNALQAQINPHFLYNTLDSIIWMAEGKKSEEVVLMVSALARLFRASIGKGEELIPLKVEIEHITNYLTIQKMRYNDKLDFRIEVDPTLLHYKTLKIILQPLVENALYHGIKNKSGIGEITITGQLKDGRIYLQVKDNGVGMDETALRSILERKDMVPGGKGFGIYNVNERIKLYFGEIYALSFESEPGEGTTVTVCIPAVA
jgi:two-component system sensor histidine kinase YesM